MNLSFNDLKATVFLAFLLIFVSCELNFSYNNPEDKSAPNDINEKLSTKENGLQCEEITISNGSKVLKSSSIIYGEELIFDFSDIKGFTKENERIFPGLQILVLEKNKDTVLHYKDLYINEVEGVEISPVDLSTSVIMAKPVQSKNEYTILTKIWDKKGSGTFEATLKINLIPNKKIKVKNDDFKFNEVYLYSDKREKTITDNKVILNENIHFVFEGLDGFKRNKGKVSVGASIEVKDTQGARLIKEDDLFKDTPEVEISELKKGFYPYVFFTKKESKGPIKLFCKIKIWDKKTNRSMKVSTTLILVDKIK